MIKVKVGDELLLAEAGQYLSDVLIKYGKKIEQPCGGRGTCGKCKVLVDKEEQRACRYVLQSDVTVELMEQEYAVLENSAEKKNTYCRAESEIQFEIPAVQNVCGTENNMTEHLCFVLDVGTTTLALALLSLDEQRIVQVETTANPQRIFGADIITRIAHCQKKGVEELQKILIEELNQLRKEFQVNRLLDMYVAGNTTMLHIFCGVNPSSMGTVPYRPVFLREQHMPAETLGLHGIRNVTLLPSISAFVGADLVAGMNYVGMPEKGKYYLLVDLGTNAEIILFSEEKVLCTSAAAGPCFEGADISCGMSATEGAIISFSMDADKKSTICTIGEKKPKGICGTGLIDIIAELVRSGIIDETGYMERGDYFIAEGVMLSQSDVRQFQLAKSAVYAAIRALMHTADVSYGQIENLYISGGFSAQMNVENAIKAGLLPQELSGRILPINNSSLLGTVKYACEGGALSDYIENACYVDLATDDFFMELFIENMEFY